jgi:hypothetical protein
MKTIPLTKGYKALVDKADYERLSQYKWYFCLKAKGDKTGYAIHDFRANPEIIKKYGSRHISMHRFLLNPKKDRNIDHINGDGLDNQRKNLRVCTQSQNAANMKKRITSTNKYKGIEKSNFAERWFARIRVDGKRVYLGCYKTPEAAATAYNIAAIEHFGDFAWINKI